MQSGKMKNKLIGLVGYKKSEILKFKLKRVYDFSILNFRCRRKLNREIGFYRESTPVVINKPLSAQIKLNNFYTDKNCFIEKYGHIVLYGEENFKANKVKNKNYTKYHNYETKTNCDR